jgi:hypothetical protein
MPQPGQHSRHNHPGRTMNRHQEWALSALT